MQCPEAAHVRVLSESPGMLGPSGELGRPCPAHRHGLQLNVTRGNRGAESLSVLRLLRVLPHRPPPWSGGAVLAALQAQRARPGRVWFPETPPRPPRLPSLSKTGPPKKCHPPRSNWRSPALRPAAPLPAAWAIPLCLAPVCGSGPPAAAPSLALSAHSSERAAGTKRGPAHAQKAHLLAFEKKTLFQPDRTNAVKEEE